MLLYQTLVVSFSKSGRSVCVHGTTRAPGLTCCSDLIDLKVLVALSAGLM